MRPGNLGDIGDCLGYVPMGAFGRRKRDERKIASLERQLASINATIQQMSTKGNSKAVENLSRQRAKLTERLAREKSDDRRNRHQSRPTPSRPQPKPVMPPKPVAAPRPAPAKPAMTPEQFRMYQLRQALIQKGLLTATGPI